MGNSCSPGCRMLESLMESFCAVIFPIDVWDVTESVSEGFLTYYLLFYRNLYQDASRSGITMDIISILLLIDIMYVSINSKRTRMLCPSTSGFFLRLGYEP